MSGHRKRKTVTVVPTDPIACPECGLRFGGKSVPWHDPCVSPDADPEAWATRMAVTTALAEDMAFADAETALLRVLVLKGVGSRVTDLAKVLEALASLKKAEGPGASSALSNLQAIFMEEG